MKQQMPFKLTISQIPWHACGFSPVWINVIFTGIRFTSSWVCLSGLSTFLYVVYCFPHTVYFQHESVICFFYMSSQMQIALDVFLIYGKPEVHSISFCGKQNIFKNPSDLNFIRPKYKTKILPTVPVLKFHTTWNTHIFSALQISTLPLYFLVRCIIFPRTFHRYTVYLQYESLYYASLLPC